jgi:hypothetical protein
MANPLRGYRFQQLPLESSFGGFLATYPQTIRCLGKGDLLSNITASNEAMVLAAKDLTTDVVSQPTRDLILGGPSDPRLPRERFDRG